MKSIFYCLGKYTFFAITDTLLILTICNFSKGNFSYLGVKSFTLTICWQYYKPYKIFSKLIKPINALTPTYTNLYNSNKTSKFFKYNNYEPVGKELEVYLISQYNFKALQIASKFKEFSKV